MVMQVGEGVGEVEGIQLSDREREAVLRVLSLASFLIFFQSYLVAPLIPAMRGEFHASETVLGWLVPSYMLAYGISTLFYGPLSDRIGRRPVLLALMGAMAFTTFGTASAQTVAQLLAWRVLAGVSAGGIIPIGLALLGDLFPYARRGHAIGWIFGAIAGGMAFGSTCGALLNPLIGWRWEFVLIGVVVLAAFLLAWKHRLLFGLRGIEARHSFWQMIRGYGKLLSHPRGARTYAYIFLNGMYHSGIFAWLGLYFSQRYHLGDRGIGLALLGYGVPGMLLGPVIGRAADRLGRRIIIPAGFALAAVAAWMLAPAGPLWLAVAAVTVLSLGYDMSHPLLAGIVTSLDPVRRGQAMGLNAFVLFMGFGLGALVFEGCLRWGFGGALVLFAGVQMGLALVGIGWFWGEKTQRSRH